MAVVRKKVVQRRIATAKRIMISSNNNDQEGCSNEDGNGQAQHGSKVMVTPRRLVSP